MKKLFPFLLFSASFIIFVLLLCNFVSQYRASVAAFIWQPRLVCNTEYSFGDVDSPEEYTCDFSVENSGSGNLVIKRVTPGCGACVRVAEYTKTPIPAGKTGNIKLVLLTKHLSGEITKDVLVNSNDTKNPEIILTLTANVNRPDTAQTESEYPEK
jgi:hypothetical protein